jgi:hypothetical protein
LLACLRSSSPSPTKPPNIHDALRYSYHTVTIRYIRSPRAATVPTEHRQSPLQRSSQTSYSPETIHPHRRNTQSPERFNLHATPSRPSALTRGMWPYSVMTPCLSVRRAGLQVLRSQQHKLHSITARPNHPQTVMVSSFPLRSTIQHLVGNSPPSRQLTAGPPSSRIDPPISFNKPFLATRPSALSAPPPAPWLFIRLLS